MTFLSNLFPKVTTSKERFIEHMIITCEAKNIEEEKKAKWVTWVRNSMSAGHYVWNMIYIGELKASTIIHEFVHHIVEHIKRSTNSKKWEILHCLNDRLYILVYIREKELVNWS